MVAERVWFYNISRGAAVQSAYSKYRKILNLLYLGQFFLHPVPLEDGLHAECGKLQQLLAVPPLRLSRRRAV